MATMNHLNKAISKAGGRKQLADLIGVSRQAVEKWMTYGVPPRRAIQIEEATGVSRKKLCPELYE